MASSKVTVAASSLLVMLSVLLVVLILTKPSLAAGPPAKSGKNLVDQWIKDLEDPNLLDSSDSEGGSEAPSEQDNNPGPVGNATTPDPVDRQTPHGAGGLGPARNPGPAQADDIPNLQDDFAPRRLSLNSPPGGPLQLLAGVAAYGGSLSLANFAEVVPLQPRLPELPLGPLTTQELNAIASPSSNLVTYDQGRRSPLLRAYRKAMAAKVPGEAGAARGAKRRQSEDSDAHQANTGVDAREELRIAGGFDAWLPFGSAHRSKRASLAMEWINGTNGPAAGARATRPLSNAGRRRVVMEEEDEDLSSAAPSRSEREPFPAWRRRMLLSEEVDGDRSEPVVGLERQTGEETRARLQELVEALQEGLQESGAMPVCGANTGRENEGPLPATEVGLTETGELRSRGVQIVTAGAASGSGEGGERAGQELDVEPLEAGGPNNETEDAQLMALGVGGGVTEDEPPLGSQISPELEAELCALVDSHSGPRGQQGAAPFPPVQPHAPPQIPHHAQLPLMHGALAPVQAAQQEVEVAPIARRRTPEEIERNRLEALARRTGALNRQNAHPGQGMGQAAPTAGSGLTDAQRARIEQNLSAARRLRAAAQVTQARDDFGRLHQTFRRTLQETEAAMDALQGKLQSIRQRQNAVARAPEARAPEARGPHRVSPHEMRTLSRITLLQNGARRGSQEAEDGLRALEAGLIAARRRLLELNQYEPLLRPRTPPQQGPNVPRTLSNLQLPNNPAPWNQPQQSAPVSVQHAPQVSNEVRSNQAGPVQDIAGRQDPGQIGRHQAQQVPLSPDLTVAEIDRLLRQIQERRQ